MMPQPDFLFGTFDLEFDVGWLFRSLFWTRFLQENDTVGNAFKILAAANGEVCAIYGPPPTPE